VVIVWDAENENCYHPVLLVSSVIVAWWYGW